MTIRRRIKGDSKKAGLAPGTIVYTGEKLLESIRITVIDYDETNFQEKQVARIEDCFGFQSTPTVSWINIDGLHDVEVIEVIGKHYDIHPLTLEDIVHTGQRPKFEESDKYLFFVLMMLRFDEKNNTILSEQVSFVLGTNYVLSFQEKPGDVFDNIRERIRNSKGRIRKMGADYLIYSLIDAVVDNYFVILEKLAERIEALEDGLVKEPTDKMLHQIHYLKRELVFLRKSVWPLRELISGMQRSESPFIKNTTGIFLRDVYDHTIQVIDTVESFRDMVSGMLDIYLSSISNRMNAVMKVLTIIATIFIPLTFVAGIYGMNFRYMPELNWQFSYPAVLLIMLIITGGMIYYFKKKKWL